MPCTRNMWIVMNLTVCLKFRESEYVGAFISAIAVKVSAYSLATMVVTGMEAKMNPTKTVQRVRRSSTMKYNASLLFLLMLASSRRLATQQAAENRWLTARSEVQPSQLRKQWAFQSSYPMKIFTDVTRTNNCSS
jgi:hypothetical protein